MSLTHAAKIAFGAHSVGLILLGYAALHCIDTGDKANATALVVCMMLYGPISILYAARYLYGLWTVKRGH